MFVTFTTPQITAAAEKFIETIGTPAQVINGSIAGAGASPAPTIGDIIGAYKSLVANGCLNICKGRNEMMGKFWQRDYHDHIIRNEHSYQNISYYIINNVPNWNGDKFYNA